MKTNKKIVRSFLYVFFLFTIISCDSNNSSKIEEAKIYSNQEDAKLLVMATKNYIQIISYNNYIKTNENLSTEVKMFLNFFNRNITKRLNNLKEISRDELILLPHVNEVVFHDKNSSYKEKKNEFKLLKNLNTLIDNQLDVLKRLVNNSNNTAIHVFANDSGDFIQEQKYNIKSIINKN